MRRKRKKGGEKEKKKGGWGKETERYGLARVGLET